MLFKDKTQTLEIGEEELKKALEFYIKNVYREDVTVTHLKHNTGYRTEGYGMMEMDVPYQEGLTLTVKEI